MMNQASYQTLQAECCTANRDLHQLGIVDLTFGNVSIVDRQAGVMAIKPSGVAYDELQPGDIPVLRLDAAPDSEGKLDLEAARVAGTLRPSSDTPTHLNLYRLFAGIGSVVHTHSRYATAFAQAGRPIPCLGTTHADYFYGTVPIARTLSPEEVDRNYEWETGNAIGECFVDRDPMTLPAVLLHGHAPFVWAENCSRALENAHALEIIAELTWKALLLNPSADALPAHLLDKHYLRKHGKTAYYGQDS